MDATSLPLKAKLIQLVVSEVAEYEVYVNLLGK